MRHSKYIGFLVAILLNQTICSQTLSEKIDGIIEQQLPNATVGVFIKEAQNNKIIYSRNVNKLLSPASSMKLFIAASALYQLKPDFRFITTLSKKEQNYYVTFTGSPSFTQDNLSALLLKLKQNKISQIEGNLVIDSSQYQAPNYSSGTSYDDLGWYYAAPATAAILNENKVSYDLISAEKLGERAQIKPKSLSKALMLINEITTVSKDEEKNHCSLNLEIKPNNTIRLYGCVAQEKNPTSIKLAIPEPLLFIKQVIQNIINENEIKLKGHIVTGVTPKDAEIIAHYYSPNLVKLVTYMLRESDNLYANSLTKKLGYSLTGKGTYKEGAFAMKKILSEHTHLDVSKMEISDGSGETRYNLVTAEQMTTLLNDLYHDQTMQSIFFKALPQAGVSGSLKERMKKTMLEKKVYAKTGTMHDISSLSGFLVTPNAKTYVFSIIINGVNQPIARAKQLEEKILLAVDEYSLEANA